MATNILHPEEWPDIIAAIRSGDPNIGSRLADRERRFDNYFATYPYVPVLKTGGAVKTCTVVYADVFRIGTRVWITAEVTATQAGAANATVRLMLPPELPAPAYTAGESLAGVFTVKEVSSGKLYVGAARIDVDNVTGWPHNLTDKIGPGTGTTIASGDSIAMSINYPTINNPLV